MTHTDRYGSPLGEIILTADETGLTGLRFADGRAPGPGAAQDAVCRETEITDQTKAWLDLYFSGREPDFFPPLHMSGSPFSMRVWQILRDIPYGATVAYGQIADAIAKERGLKKMSAQAVGNAVGRNPVSILVPCHRVVGADGGLTGYGGGLWRKQALLTLEGAFPIKKDGR